MQGTEGPVVKKDRFIAILFSWGLQGTLSDRRSVKRCYTDYHRSQVSYSLQSQSGSDVATLHPVRGKRFSSARQSRPTSGLSLVGTNRRAVRMRNRNLTLGSDNLIAIPKTFEAKRSNHSSQRRRDRGVVYRCNFSASFVLQRGLSCMPIGFCTWYYFFPPLPDHDALS